MIMSKRNQLNEIRDQKMTNNKFLKAINPRSYLTIRELVIIIFAALGFLYLLANFPLNPITFVYQEI